jgi:hypothetical protein
MCYRAGAETQAVKVVLLMADPPMFLEYDRTFNAFHSHLGGAFTSHYFESLDAARLALRLIGLCLGAKTDPSTWQIEFIEPVTERADALHLGSWARRLNAQHRSPL